MPLKNEILRLIAEGRRAGIQAPQFDGLTWMQGAFLDKCANEWSCNWLTMNGEALARALTPGLITIAAARPFMIPKPRVVMLLFLEKGTNLPLDTCETLAAQNGLCADDWREIGRYVENDRVKFMVAVDESSKEAIVAKNSKLHFGWGVVSVTFLKSNNDGMSDQQPPNRTEEEMDVEKGDITPMPGPSTQRTM